MGLFRNQGSYNTIQKQIANDEFTFFDGSGMDMTEACAWWIEQGSRKFPFKSITPWATASKKSSSTHVCHTPVLTTQHHSLKRLHRISHYTVISPNLQQEMGLVFRFDWSSVRRCCECKRDFCKKKRKQPFSATFPGHVEISGRTTILNTDWCKNERFLSKTARIQKYPEKINKSGECR